jgi:predicted nuclease of predicted toxin-antitoxin system
MGVSPRVITWLRAQGHDALHLREQGLQRLADRDVFAKAASESRILLTFDLDFGEIVALATNPRTTVVVFRLHDTRTARVIERLADVLEQSTDTLLNTVAIIVVEDSRHRVRRYPTEP